MYDPRGYVQIPADYGKVRFSKIEIKHVLISVLALTIIFALSFNYIFMDRLGTGYMESMAITLAVSLVAVLLGFLIHEMGHKVVAQKYGAWAEFRMYPMGLAMGFVFSLLGFMLVAPGAVYIQGQITKRQYGLVSLAGPLTNIVIGGSFLAGYIILGTSSTLGFVFQMLATISLFLAVFNLLPIPPLDGSKVARWNIPLYLAVLGGSILLLLVSWGIIKV